LPWRQRILAARGEDASLDHAIKDPGLVRLSRILVIVWGIILCLMAQVADAASEQFPQILNLALAMAGYTSGAILAGFMLAFLRLKIDVRGYLWSAPLSVFIVFSLVWHEPWANLICWAGAIVMLISWLVHLRSSSRNPHDATSGTSFSPVLPPAIQTILLILGLGLMLWLSYFGYIEKQTARNGQAIKYISVAWPWFVPIGSLAAFVFGCLLARKKLSSEVR